MSSAAVQRLQRDLQEVLQNPLASVVGLPLESDILQWHVNVRPEEESLLGDAPFHLILVFSDSYPKTGPMIKVLSPLPHPNVSRRQDGSWQLSLWDCIPGFQGWTSAYSVQSVLLQLQTFLLDEDLQYDVSKVTMERALQLARSAKCKICPHDASLQFFPKFHTSEDIKLCMQRRKKLQVSRPLICPLSQPLLSSGKPAKFEGKSSLFLSNAMKLSSSQVPDSQAQSAPENGAHPTPEIDGWRQPKGRQAIKQKTSIAEQNSEFSDSQAHPTTENDGWQQVQGRRGGKERRSTGDRNFDDFSSRKEHRLETNDAGKVLQVDTASSVKERCIEDAMPLHNMCFTRNVQTKAGKKNSARSENSATVTSSQLVSIAVPPLGSWPRAKLRLGTSNAEKKSTGKCHQTEKNKEEGAKVVITDMNSSEKSGAVAVMGDSKNLKEEEGFKDAIEELAGLDKPSASMGYFGLLPAEALTTILCQLSLKDLSFLSMTCQGMKEACEDGVLWRELMHLHFPAAGLTAATLEDWKHAYALEQSSIIGSLQCFYTRRTFEEDILGFPISFTRNPRTGAIDYIDVSVDLLSEVAYVKYGVRTTANNNKFDLLLPIYINQEHFDRAIPLLKKTAIALCPDWKSDKFHPGMVIDFMPKLLNTMVVLLSDKGIAASERATDGYCMLHRLFLALCDKFQLWQEAEGKVLKFKEMDQARRKQECPSLGNFITLLSVCSSQQASWQELVRPWISETFDRAVIWACKSHPELVDKYKVDPRNEGADEEMLQATLQAHKISLRLAMFHAGFLRLIARPEAVSLQKVAATYDSLYGMPSLSLKRRFQSYVTNVISNHSWPYFFQVVGLQCPTKENLTKWLRQNWLNSLSKGYHTKKTDFSFIQRSGISKVLLKGESYTAPPNMKTVMMLEHWRYKTDIQFLDASCLLYDFSGKLVEIVDYHRTSSLSRAVTHSGDIIDYEKKEGTHRINIFLEKLPEIVKELYFTMSGWAGAKIKDIRLPFVQLKDIETVSIYYIPKSLRVRFRICESCAFLPPFIREKASSFIRLSI
ncbi:hypothetical protein O6H91_18G063500 [Diphasiastrum complanatum]|uniref:Uncharacterized protein n=1 Tax=Diphasiastrum complanatum TaxID=34168 RepID=A0ACC2B237_DIPCM|nr:hypothetical protein O6H91_18G063500 [Diphasiastrum complanatum]